MGVMIEGVGLTGPGKPDKQAGIARASGFEEDSRWPFRDRRGIRPYRHGIHENGSGDPGPGALSPHERADGESHAAIAKLKKNKSQ